MIYLQDLEVHLAKLKKDLEEKLEHPFLVKHLPSPKIDEDKLLLLCAIFDEIDLSEEVRRSYILTAILVQIALDTHDDVSTNLTINSEEFIQRQLIVLAGDYFSGLYYLLLSEIGDIKMVRTLAMAIKEINEHKIRLYHDHNLKLISMMNSLQIVETSLFQHIADHFKLNSLKAFSIDFLTYKRLSHEKSQLIRGLKRSQFSISYLTDACNMYFDKSISHLPTAFLRGPGYRDLLLDRLHSIRFHDCILNEKKTVEEGL
ncbi:heptaprenyl diphosphate synthase component 1 [Metabacillus schmidteae]|uniref:heptaprenyl diphosphate synthase component 1 n=1 Tax=Metabacillus schmidteae TaxID=2730405 RepID=UPI00158B89AD|nr:heptaprenyl diphosphate synthase component 1 [Metabacillus schmidteae]